MMNNSRFFVGYPELEDLLRTHQRRLPLYLSVPTEIHPTGHAGFQYLRTYASVADVQDDVCRYWRMRIAYSTQLYDQVLDPGEGKDAHRRAASIERALKSILHERFRISPHRAVVSIPQDVRMLDGTTSLLRYDKAQDLYFAVPLRTAAVPSRFSMRAAIKRVGAVLNSKRIGALIQRH